MEKLVRILSESEDLLMDKILAYAKKFNYVKYTSTLREAWRLSVSGLSAALIDAVKKNGEIPELGPDDDFSQEEISQFGIIEAKRHRCRGVTLGMYMGLMKYYEQAYIDLIQESDCSSDEKAYFSQYVNRFFDHTELGFIMEWKELTEKQRLIELQNANREMTNEKNKYLTVFESIYDPILLIDKDNRIENINYKAAELFLGAAASGMNHYSDMDSVQELDWLKEELRSFSDSNRNELLQEKSIDTKSGPQTFLIKYYKMLDISEKYKGTVVIFYDISDRKKMEKELKIRNDILEIYASSDPMTGVLNRRIGLMMLEKELALIPERSLPLSVCFLDLDGLKNVNDTYGHAQGDFMINSVVSAIKSSIRENDSVSRMGGDEFLIIFPDDHEVAAEQTVKRIYSVLEEDKRKAKMPFDYSFSYGIIEIRNGRWDANEVIRAADEKMYLHKQSKKNTDEKDTAK